jgi:hypothetical protein
MSIMRLTKCTKLRSMRSIIIVIDVFWVAQRSLDPLLMILKNYLLVQKTELGTMSNLQNIL